MSISNTCTCTDVKNFQVDTPISGINGPINQLDFGKSLTDARAVNSTYIASGACFAPTAPGANQARDTPSVLGNGFCPLNGEFVFEGLTSNSFECNYIGSTGSSTGTCNLGGCKVNNPQLKTGCSTDVNSTLTCCNGNSTVSIYCVLSGGRAPVCRRTRYSINSILEPFGTICLEAGATLDRTPQGSLNSFFFPSQNNPALGAFQLFKTCNPILMDTSVDSVLSGQLNTYCNGSSLDQVVSFQYGVRNVNPQTNVLQQFGLPPSSTTLFSAGGIRRMEQSFCQTFVKDQILKNGPFSTQSEDGMATYCKGDDLRWFVKPICREFYIQFPTLAAKPAILPSIMDFCTRDTNMEGPGVGASFCRPIVSDAIKINTGSTTVDEALVTYCEKRGVTLENFATQNIELQQICSCHLPASVYLQYVQLLQQTFPALQAASLGAAECLLNNCSGSPFPNVSTAKPNSCPAIQCIQSVSIDVSNSIVNDIKNAQDGICAQFNNTSSSDNFVPDGQVTAQEQLESEQQSQTTIIAVSVAAAIVALLIILIPVGVLVIKPSLDGTATAAATTTKSNSVNA